VVQADDGSGSIEALMSRLDLVDFWCFLIMAMSPLCLISVGSVRCRFGLFASKEPFLYIYLWVLLPRKSLLGCWNVDLFVLTVDSFAILYHCEICAHYLIPDVSRFVDICRFQRIGFHVSVICYPYQSP
jgi:hypothetical protein